MLPNMRFSFIATIVALASAVPTPYLDDLDNHALGPGSVTTRPDDSYERITGQVPRALPSPERTPDPFAPPP